jgi:hypothetical protein
MAASTFANISSTSAPTSPQKPGAIARKPSSRSPHTGRCSDYRTPLNWAVFNQEYAVVEYLGTLESPE